MNSQLIMDYKYWVSFFLNDLINQGFDITSCYITGSYADGYFLPNYSDIDLFLILDSNGKVDNDIVLKSLSSVKNKSGFELDITMYLADSRKHYQNSTISEGIIPAKIAGKLFYGIDFLKNITISMEAYRLTIINFPLIFIKRCRKTEQIKQPLQYPNMHDYYYGYVSDNKSTKLIVSLYTWIGTSIVTSKNKVFVGNKIQSIDLLLKHDKKLGKYAAYIFEQCRNKWKYSVPNSDTDKKELSSFCKELLFWENHYLTEILEKK